MSVYTMEGKMKMDNTDRRMLEVIRECAKTEKSIALRSCLEILDRLLAEQKKEDDKEVQHADQ